MSKRCEAFETAQIWLFIKLRNLALWVGGYEHIGGAYEQNYVTIYARKKGCR